MEGTEFALSVSVFNKGIRPVMMSHIVSLCLPILLLWSHCRLGWVQQMRMLIGAGFILITCCSCCPIKALKETHGNTPIIQGNTPVFLDLQTDLSVTYACSLMLLVCGLLLQQLP